MSVEEYVGIVIGTGSAMSIVDPLLGENDGKVAVIDKDEPGGICLTRGCIPSKNLLYPADLVREIEKAQKFGITAPVNKIDFNQVMERMRSHIDPEIRSIERGLSGSEALDYYREPAEFVEPYTLKVGGQRIRSDLILLCTGSKPLIPPIEGIEEVDYLTSRSVLELETRPSSLIIVGGGYIGVEYAHFFSSMGTDVTVVEMKPRILPRAEPEISRLAEEKMKRYMDVSTGRRAVEIRGGPSGEKELVTVEDGGKDKDIFSAEEIMIASGRAPNTDLLNPKAGGIETDEDGWIKVDERLETSQEGVWALGDALGRHMFKHAANYEARVVYRNAILNRETEVDYHAVPRAIFGHPKVASVGMGEAEAVERYGKEEIAIGSQKYENTAKGEAMGVEDYFVKIIVKRDSGKILGAHIVGPQAPILIQEIVNLMYTEDGNFDPIREGMHIHPALSEVVERAFFNLTSVDHYHHHLNRN